MDRARVAALLRERQGDRSQRAFARHLGVSPALLNLVMRGKVRLGVSGARRVLARYPELRGALADAVLAHECGEVAV